MKQIIGAITLVLAFLALAGPSSGDSNDLNRRFYWPTLPMVELKPTADQQAQIDAAISEGRSIVVVALTDDQRSRLRRVFGSNAPTTSVRLSKHPGPGTTITLRSGTKATFHPLYLTSCFSASTGPTCTTRIIDFEIRPSEVNARALAAFTSRMKIAPVFTAAQRRLIETAQRNGLAKVELSLTPQQKDLLRRSFGANRSTMNLTLMRTDPPSSKYIGPLSCQMTWIETCDNYGCHMLCYPQCD